MTAMISVNTDKPPFFFDIRTESNTGLDFLQFMLVSLNERYLQPGDIIIMDNASVHNADEFTEDLYNLLQENNIDLRFLPCYSPELSPIELCFNIIKNHIQYRRSKETLLDAILDGVGSLSHDKVLNTYLHVVHTFVENPLAILPNYLEEQ